MGNSANHPKRFKNWFIYMFICISVYVFYMYVHFTHFRFGKHQALPNMNVGLIMRNFKGFCQWKWVDVAKENGENSQNKETEQTITHMEGWPWKEIDLSMKHGDCFHSKKDSLTSNGILGILFQASDMRSQGIKLRTRGTVCLKIGYPWHEPTKKMPNP